jgi:hypothetical protein
MKTISLAELERQLLHNNSLIDQVAEKFFDQKRQILQLKRQRTSRKTSVATLVKRAEKSGRTVTSVSVVLMFGEPKAAASDLDQWLAKRAKHALQT